MVKGFILVGLFIVIVYVYSIRKIKRNKEMIKNIDSVKGFHNNYDHLIGQQKTRTPRLSDDYQNYVTKYNSSEDYREKL